MFKGDTVPRAQMALQSHESLNVSRHLRQQLLGGGCCSSTNRTSPPQSIVDGLVPAQERQQITIVQGVAPVGQQQQQQQQQQQLLEGYTVQGHPIPFTRRQNEAERIWNSALAARYENCFATEYSSIYAKHKYRFINMYNTYPNFDATSSRRMMKTAIAEMRHEVESLENERDRRLRLGRPNTPASSSRRYQQL